MTTIESMSQDEAESALSAALDCESLPSGARSILAAAARVFARKGYGPTTVRTIASAADVTVPMVYYYFDGKEQIFVTLFECLGRDFFSRLKEVETHDGISFREQLVAVASVFRSLLYPCPVTLQLMTQFVFGPPESRPCLEEEGEREQLAEFFREMFETAVASGRFQPTPGYEPAELAMYFINVVHSHTMYVMKEIERSKIGGDSLYREFLADDALERLVDIFLKGAGESMSPA
jgi:AcrR family transcriptional regulator